MKSLSKFILFYISVTITSFLMGCTSGAKPAESGNLTLDQAIKNASEEIDARFEAGVKIALLNFISTSDQFSAYVLDELTANLVNSKHLIIIDRNEIDLIRREQNFQMSGDVDDDSMQALGKMLGAETIVSGSLIDIGGSYRITIRALMVQTAVVAVQYRTDISDDSRAQALLGNSKPQPVQQTPAKTVKQPPAAQPIVTPSKPYEVGDPGPAGGVVFYDKGNFSDGWRYLEYAPSGFRGKYWASFYTNIAGTEIGIGSGKKNTELLVKTLKRRGDKDMAAQLCDDLVLGGFTDWFLPSKDELNLLYEYLRGNAMLESRYGFYTWFYSSSQYDESNAWGHNFMNGYQGAYIKNVSMGGDVRAIRAF